jgi:hypothetical protein
MAAAARRCDPGLVLQHLEGAHPGRHGTFDVAVGDPMAQADDHGGAQEGDVERSGL